MERKYYLVNPEFDGFRFKYVVHDKRKTEGFREEFHEFVGGEIFSYNQYKRILKISPAMCDIFKEIKSNPDDLYDFFGVKFSHYHYFEPDEISHAKIVRKHLISRLVILLEKTQKYIDENSHHDRKEILAYIKHFSNKTLEMEIDFYQNYLKEKEYWKYEARNF